MTKRTLESLRAAFGDNKTEGNNNGSFSNNYFPFWNMPVNSSAVIRFLPDLNDENPRGFMVEKVFHNLTINGKKRSVPCLSMYGEPCPICKVSQDYYKAKDEVNGKKYWRKKQYLAQAIVVDDPLPAGEDGETHEGKVRNISLGYQLYNIIKEAFASETDPLDGIPYDYTDGYDFIIKKTEQGKYSTYVVGTKFASRPRTLTEEEMATVAEDMIDLATLLPKHPGLETVQGLLNADLNGEEYGDSDNGSDGDSDDNDPPFETRSTPAAKPAAAPAPAASAAEGNADENVDAMLARINARRAARAAAE